MPITFSPATFTISDTTPDGPVDFLSFILLINSLKMSLTIKLGMLLNFIYLRLTILVLCKLCVQKLLMITFPSCFLDKKIAWESYNE